MIINRVENKPRKVKKLKLVNASANGKKGQKERYYNELLKQAFAREIRQIGDEIFGFTLKGVRSGC